MEIALAAPVVIKTLSQTLQVWLVQRRSNTTIKLKGPDGTQISVLRARGLRRLTSCYRKFVQFWKSLLHQLLENQPVRIPDPDYSNAILVGTATYQSADLPNIPAVYNNLVQLASVISDPELGGFAAARCTTLLNPVDGRAVYEVLRGPAAEATDTFLVYFTGHGLLSSRGELYLAVANTDPDALSVSALAFDVIKEVFRKSPAVNRILILDCCYSGRASRFPHGNGD